MQHLTVKEAAAEMRVSVATVYALCARGLIRHERHGVGRGAIRLTREALTEYRKSRERGGPPAVVVVTPPPARTPPRPRHLRLKP